MCFLLAIFLKFISLSEKKRGFLGPKTFDIFTSKTSNFLLRKESCSLKIVAHEFQKDKNI